MRFVICGTYLFTGVFLFALPTLSKRHLLFAVTVSPEFRQGPEARRAIRTFRACMLPTIGAALVTQLLCPLRLLDSIALASTFLTSLAFFLAYYVQYRRLSTSAVQLTPTHQVEISVGPDRVPPFAWSALGPFLLLAAAALVLYLSWDRIPSRFPIHYDILGNPNGWATRTFRGVFGPLFIGLETTGYVILLAFASWFGSRRSSPRRLMLSGLITTGYIVAATFAIIALIPVLHLPPVVLVTTILGSVFGLIFWLARKWSELPGSPEPTPNDCWKFGMQYYNPDDPALFVERRDGLGFTLNFANRWSWGLILLTVLFVLSIFLLVNPS